MKPNFKKLLRGFCQCGENVGPDTLPPWWRGSSFKSSLSSPCPSLPLLRRQHQASFSKMRSCQWGRACLGSLLRDPTCVDCPGTCRDVRARRHGVWLNSLSFVELVYVRPNNPAESFLSCVITSANFLKFLSESSFQFTYG